MVKKTPDQSESDDNEGEELNGYDTTGINQRNVSPEAEDIYGIHPRLISLDESVNLKKSNPELNRPKLERLESLPELIKRENASLNFSNAIQNCEEMVDVPACLVYPGLDSSLYHTCNINQTENLTIEFESIKLCDPHRRVLALQEFIKPGVLVRQLSRTDSELEELLSKFDWKEICIRIVFLGLYLFDVATDFYSAHVHYANKDFIFFGLTLSFIFIPGFATSAISLKYYLGDERKRNGTRKHWIKRWAIIWVFLITMLSPVLKDIDSLRYGFKMRSSNNDKEKQKKYLERMNKEDQDKYLLKFLLALLEDGPQLILQFVALASPSTHNSTFDQAKLIIGMVASLIGLSVTHACFHRNLRILKGKRAGQLSWPITAVIAVWTLFFLIARVLALGLVGIMCPLILTCVLIHRWIVMNIWTASMENRYCSNRLLDVLYHMTLSGVFMFIYVNLKDTPTIRRQIFFYLYSFVENLSLMLLWYFNDDPATWYRTPAMLTHFLSYFAGVILLVIYYTFLHPKAVLGVNLKLKELVP